MNSASPTPRQARIFWTSITALSVAVLVALLGLLLWGLGSIANRLSAVLLPLALAGVLAYLLDPVVDFFERKKVPRVRAILLVFFIAVMLALALLATVVPQLVVEIGLLIDELPSHLDLLQAKVSEWLAGSGGAKARELWETQVRPNLQTWLTKAAPVVSGWLLVHLGKAASWFGLLMGLFLVPVYAFYFLLEKQKINRSWTNYLPLHESRWKEEVVFIVKSVNDSLIVFFRGQVLVAMCVGALVTIGYLLLGLHYAFLLGLTAAVLGIIPYLGAITSGILAVTVALIQFGDWLHPLLVVVVFVLAQVAEGFWISPKIIGDRVGLHPLTVIVAVMVGTTLMGGILGGVVAIPLTAVLRTLMFRYVWKRP